MFTEAELKQTIIKGHNTNPAAIQLANLVKNNSQRIRQFLESLQTRVVSGHIVLQILSQIGYAGDPTYEDVEWACRRRLIGIGNAMNLISLGSYGRVYNGKFIEGQDELIALTVKPINPTLPFRHYSPAKYLYHDYTNINWILGNGKPRGISVIEINLVELLWQYVKAEQYYRNKNSALTLPVYAWRHVISRMLPSYMDISLINIHRAVANEQPIESEETLRTIPTPPMQDIAIRSAKNVHQALSAGNPLPGVVLYHHQLPFVREDGTGLDKICQHLPGNTFQAEWHQSLVNWEWMLYCFRYNKGLMNKYYSTLAYNMDRFTDTKVLNKLPKPVYNHLQTSLIKPLWEIITQ